MVRTWDGPKFTVLQRREAQRAAWDMVNAEVKQKDIAKELGVAQSTVHYWIAAIRAGRSDYLVPTVFEQIATRIRAEMVCCDIYQRIKEAEGRGPAELTGLRQSSAYHDICFWGEAAAQLALAEGRR